jgi:hypothetical protein
MYGHVAAYFISLYEHFLEGAEERKNLCQDSRYSYRCKMKPKYSRKCKTDVNFWNATFDNISNAYFMYSTMIRENAK